VQDQEILPNEVGGPGGKRRKEDLYRQRFVVSSRAPECIADAEEEWRLFKAAVVSSAAWVFGRTQLGVANNGKK